MQTAASQRSTFFSWSGILILGILILLIPIPAKFHTPGDQFFQVQASRFSYTPSVLRVNRGDRVTIELAAMDVVHGLSIDAYDLEISADPGKTAQLTFTADRTGSFRLSCSVTCGDMHPFMIGKLQVGNNELLWRGISMAVLLAFTAVWRGRANHG